MTQSKSNLLQRTSTIALATALIAGPAQAAIDEIVVTSQKREQNLQDVAISVQVLDTAALDNLQIDNFEDYALLLPSVSFQSQGPGNAQIYMRGVSDGGDGNFSGSSPSAALYLDEQPATSIGRNLDIHVYDIARVESLPGPQGTLYGASSQAGTIRIITNEPNMDGFEAGYDVGANTIEDGDYGYSAEGFVNMPISDKAAIRLVGWHVKEGGYIDNVNTTKEFLAGNKSDGTAKSKDGSTTTINNAAYAGEDFNEAEKTGMRAALKMDLNDSWTGKLSYMYQKQETDGVWDHDPEDVGDLKVARFFEDSGEDEFSQIGLTLEGQVGSFDLIYAGSYMDREVEYNIDYSEYSEYSDYLTSYYVCSYEYSCTDPRIQYENNSDYKRQTHEIRIQSDQEKRLSFVAGLFYEENEHEYFNNWRIPGGLVFGAAGDNPLIPASATTPDSYFITNQERTEVEKAIFGEVSYDITDKLTATIGARAFEHRTKLEGFVGTVFSSSPVVNLKAKEDDIVWKGNLTYQVNDDVMVYGTISEGYRAGGINRTFTSNIPQIYNSDLITNYELGWKTILADNTLRFNGAIFLMDWDEMQVTRFDPAESFLGLTTNAKTAEIKGIEMDATWQPNDAWEISGAMTYLDAELSKDFVRNISDASATIPSGTSLPGIPDLKANVTARYNFAMANMENMFAQLTYAYVDESINDIVVQEKQDSYDILNLSTGIDEENWGLTLYLHNATDERAELFRNSVDFDDRITTNRPRTFGIKFKQRF